MKITWRCHRSDHRQGPPITEQKLPLSEKWATKRQVNTKPLKGFDYLQNELCLSDLGICSGQPSAESTAAVEFSSASLVTDQGAYRPALYVWCSIFLTSLTI